MVPVLPPKMTGSYFLADLLSQAICRPSALITYGDDDMPDLSKLFDGKKYMWNGQEYPDRDSAEKVKDNYLKDGFEVELVQEDAKYLVYSRRLVTEIVMDGGGAP